MNGIDLKKALMLRHEVARHPLPAAEVEDVLRKICTLMRWDAGAAVRELETQAQTAGTDRDEAYLAYLKNALRERLNQAKWEFIRTHPGDPAAREIVALARAWQRRTSAPGWNDDGDRPLDFPSEEEAYGEAERSGNDD